MPDQTRNSFAAEAAIRIACAIGLIVIASLILQAGPMVVICISAVAFAMVAIGLAIEYARRQSREQKPPIAHPSTEQRLRKLKQLHADGLITDAEYAARRQAALDEV